MKRSPAADSFRFRPPPQSLPTAAGWALLRGLGPVDREPGPAVDARLAVFWAARFGLVERIGARCPLEVLAAETDRRRAEELVAAAHRTAALNLLLRELAAKVTRAAAERGLTVVLLKGIALLATVPDLDARRPMADVDLLIDAGAGRELARVLEGRGFNRSSVHESAQHLPALHHPRLGTVELHVHLPAVGPRRAAPARAEHLLADGDCRPAPGMEPALVPSRSVLAAHAIAHALVQNVNSPAGYPLLRVVADLQDLASGEPPLGRLVDLAAPWLGTAVSRRELDALTALGDSLAAGAAPPAGSDARHVLDHVLASQVDDGYRRSLRAKALGEVLRRRDWLKIRRRTATHTAIGRLFRVGWGRLSRRLRRGGGVDVF